MTNKYIPKPWKYKTWNVWPETVLNFLNISGCDNTIDGMCLSGKTLKQCIDKCTGTCKSGYHIEFENGETICAPMRTDIHPKLNQLYRLRNKSVYPELDDVKVSTFIDSSDFPFPSDDVNSVFYRDIFTIAETVSGKTINSGSDMVKDDNLIYFGSNFEGNVQFLRSLITVDQITEYIPVRYGDPLRISIPLTSLSANVSTNRDGMLIWESGTTVFYGNDDSFYIIPIGKEKKIGDVLTYGDTFSISHSENSIVVLNPKYNFLQTEYAQLDVLENKKYVHTFKLISKMRGWYCDKESCKSVLIKDIKTSGIAGRYKGQIVGRDPECQGTCNYSKLNNESIRSRVTIHCTALIIAIMLIILIFVYMRKFK